MRTLALALLLSITGTTLAAPPTTPAPPVPGDSDDLYLYNVAVFEYNGPKGVRIQWTDFGQPIAIKDEVHKKSAAGTVDTRSVRNLQIREVAKYLRSSSGASLVANVQARPGDVIRAPCGFGTNVELDFAGAALKSGDPSSLLVKVLEIKTDAPAGAEFVGAMTGAGGSAVDQATVKFPTVDGDTFVVEVARSQTSKDLRGCVVLVTP